MRSGFLWLLSFLIFPLAGWPLLGHPIYRRLGFVSRLMLSGAVGCIAVTTAMTVSTVFHFSWQPALLVPASMVILIGARLLIGLTPDPPRPRRGDRFRYFEWIALSVIFISSCAATLAATSASATSADLVLFWGPKAMAFAKARGVDAAYLSDPLLRYQHFSYPPLVPNAYALATLLAGRFSWLAAVMTFPLLLVALGLALPGIFRGWCSRHAALVASACVIASLALIGQTYLIAGNADIFLLTFEVLAIAVLLGTERGGKASLLLSGILFAGAASAKVEGLPFVVAAGLLFLLLLASRRGFRRPAAAALLLGPTAIVVAIWFFFEKSRLGVLGYESYGPFLEADWRSSGRVVWMTARALASAGVGLPWMLPVAALAVSVPRKREALVPVLTAFVLTVFFLFTYLHGGDPSLLISWSAGRIFAVISPLLIVASVAGLKSECPSVEAADP